MLAKLRKGRRSATERRLADFLTPYQRKMLRERRYIPVTGSKGHRYRIWCNSTVSNIEVCSTIPAVTYRCDCKCGRIKLREPIRRGSRLCAIPGDGWNNSEECWLSQMLMLRTDEELVLSVAVVSAV